MSWYRNQRQDSYDSLLPSFRRLTVSKKNEKYDKNYFPKAKKINIYYNQSIKRPLWVLDPNLDYDEISYEEILIPKRSKLFPSIVNPIRKSKEFNIHIKKVLQIENKYLQRQFELKKYQKEETGYVDEEIMYHATLGEYIPSIFTNNFNWRYSGRSRGSKYGFGVSFTPNPDFAHQFCKNKKEKVLIVAKVLVSQSHIGNPNITLPNDGFDTTRSPSKAVYVKFEDSEFLPEYVIYYHANRKND